MGIGAVRRVRRSAAMARLHPAGGAHAAARVLAWLLLGLAPLAGAAALPTVV